MSQSHLIVAEQFYSIQGEGASLGMPAVFLRLAACNLNCPGFSYRDPETNEHLGCDSKHVWRQGERWTHENIIAHWREQGWLDALSDGAHLVITGGEPLLQQTKLLSFIALLDEITETPCYIEVETNATLSLLPELAARLNQINASPKLAHSGEARDDRYQLEILKTYAAHPQCYFKFVVSNMNDIDEIERDFVQQLSLNAQQIILMAEGGDASTIRQRAPMIVEVCKQKRWRYSPRAHIDIWGEVTGV